METDLQRNLRDVLANDNAVERMKALSKVGESASAEGLKIIVGLFDADGRKIRHRAAAALSHFKSPVLVEQYVEIIADRLLHHHDEWVRLSCAIYLMSAQSPVAERAYLQALSDPFVKVVQIACVQAASYGEAGRQALLGTLNHASWRVRLEACKALIIQQTADQRVVETLDRMKSDPEAAVYEAECDELDAVCGELDALVQEELVKESIEDSPWWKGRWGKLNTIIAQAREIATGNRSGPPSPTP